MKQTILERLVGPKTSQDKENFLEKRKKVRLRCFLSFFLRFSMLMRVDSGDEGLFGVKDEVAETELSLVLINLENTVLSLLGFGR